jgi:hypothetical protein
MPHFQVGANFPDFSFVSFLPLLPAGEDLHCQLSAYWFRISPESSRYFPLSLFLILEFETPKSLSRGFTVLETQSFVSKWTLPLGRLLVLLKSSHQEWRSLPPDIAAPYNEAMTQTSVREGEALSGVPKKEPTMGTSLCYVMTAGRTAHRHQLLLPLG